MNIVVDIETDMLFDEVVNLYHRLLRLGLKESADIVYATIDDRVTLTALHYKNKIYYYSE